MGNDSQPPGYCFHPTDEELVGYYLERKVYGRSLTENVISEADPYKYEPWDLRDKSCVQGRGSKLYFFSPINGKFSKGTRAVRATEAGCWKISGKDQTISARSGARAIKKTKVFYRGHATHGEITNWQMHEYMLEHDDSKLVQNSYVLCKVFQKAIPKRGERKTSENLYTESVLRSSLGIESDSLTVQPTNIIYPTGVYNKYGGKTPVEDTGNFPEDSLPPDDDIQKFLMRHICDPDDLIPNVKDNGLGEESVYINQPQTLEERTSLNGKDCTGDDVGDQHIQETVIVEDESLQFCSSWLDQHDFSPDISEGDFIELNDLITPLDLDCCSSEIY
ncbi:hypothetical protein KI387_004793, partial [Taxus chinensis]